MIYPGQTIKSKFWWNSVKDKPLVFPTWIDEREARLRYKEQEGLSKLPAGIIFAATKKELEKLKTEAMLKAKIVTPGLFGPGVLETKDFTKKNY